MRDAVVQAMFCDTLGGMVVEPAAQYLKTRLDGAASLHDGMVPIARMHLPERSMTLLGALREKILHLWTIDRIIG